MSGSATSIVNSAATLIGAGVAGYSAIKGTPKPKEAKAPTLTPPAVAPVMDDAAIQAARKKAQIARQQASGRASTNLVEETLG